MIATTDLTRERERRENEDVDGTVGGEVGGRRGNAEQPGVGISMDMSRAEQRSRVTGTEANKQKNTRVKWS